MAVVNLEVVAAVEVVEVVVVVFIDESEFIAAELYCVYKYFPLQYAFLATQL